MEAIATPVTTTNKAIVTIGATATVTNPKTVTEVITTKTTILDFTTKMAARGAIIIMTMVTMTSITTAKGVNTVRAFRTEVTTVRGTVPRVATR